MEVCHEYDYSNVVPEIQTISILAQYAYKQYDNLVKLFNENEERNEKLKLEFQNWEYKKSFSATCEVKIYNKDFYNIITCKSYESLIDVFNNNLNNVRKLEIYLDLSFRRGNELDLIEHKNLLNVSFEPYNIKFLRKSNFTDVNIDNIENEINQLLKKFRVQNTIFCTK